MEKSAAAPSGIEDEEERDVFEEYTDSIFEMMEKRSADGHARNFGDVSRE
jgi:hypothetical protein